MSEGEGKQRVGKRQRASKKKGARGPSCRSLRLLRKGAQTPEDPLFIPYTHTQTHAWTRNTLAKKKKI